MGLIGDLTAAAAQSHGEEMVNVIADLTQLPAQIVRKRLNDARRNQRVSSIFIDEWSDIRELSSHTVASACDNALCDKIAQATMLDPRIVQYVLDNTSRRTHLANAFTWAWPGRADVDSRDQTICDLLWEMPVAEIRRYDLFAEVARLSDRAENEIRNLLETTHGKRLLRNTMTDEASSGAGLDSAGEEDDATAEVDLGDHCISWIRNNEDAISELARLTGIATNAVRKRILATNGHTLIKNAFADKWPGIASGAADGGVIVPPNLTTRKGFLAATVEEVQAFYKMGGTMAQLEAHWAGSGRRAAPNPTPPAKPPRNPVTARKHDRPIKLIYIYSHKDEALLEDLKAHLTPLIRQALIDTWDYREISAGTEWAGAIDKNLEKAGIVLLLISADFLASHYCYDKEITRAIARGISLSYPECAGM
jgi:hypothetical protein